jgi:hypothetical protein
MPATTIGTDRQLIVTLLPHWHESPGQEPALMLDVTVKSSTAVTGYHEQLGLTLPAALQPAQEFVGSSPDSRVASFGDSAGTSWNVLTSTVNGNTWTVWLSPVKGKVTKPDATLHFFVGLKKPSQDMANLSVGVELSSQAPGKKPIPAEPRVIIPQLPSTYGPSGWVVKLWTEPKRAVSCEYGQPVKVCWELTNIVGNATLHGSMVDKNTKPIQPGKAEDCRVTVGAFGAAVYTLTADVKIPGQDKLETIVRTVDVDVEVAQYGARFKVWPPQVLPGGPIAAYWSAFNVDRMHFPRIHQTAPDVSEHNYPALGEDATLSLDKPIEHRSFQIKWGPGTSVPEVKDAIDAWTVSALYSRRKIPLPVDGGDRERTDGAVTKRLPDPSPKEIKSSPRNPLRLVEAGELVAGVVASLAAPTKKIFREIKPLAPAVGLGGIAGLHIAAGEFRGREGRKPHRCDFIAVADAQALRVVVVSPNKASVAQGILDGDRGKILGLGAAWETDPLKADGQWLLLAYQDPSTGVVSVTELGFADDTAATPVTPVTLTDEGFQASPRLQLLSLGERVFVLGKGVVVRYDRTSDRKPQAETALLAIASPDEWEVTALPAGTSLAARRTPSGFIFALHKKDARLLRFDVVDGKVGTPRTCAPADGDVAKLDMLQRAQLGDSAYLETLEASIGEGNRITAAVYTRRTPDAQDARRFRSSGKIVNNTDTRGEPLTRLSPVTHETILLTLDGALVARCEVVEQRWRRDLLQDRAYDPRLDVWVKCGHPFPGASRGKGALFAATRRNVYCWFPGGDPQLSYHADANASLLGFVVHADLAPIDARLLEEAKMQAHESLIAGQILPQGHYVESPNRKHRLTLKGELLALHEAGKEPGDGDWKLTATGQVAHARLTFDANLSLLDPANIVVKSASDDETVSAATRLRSMNAQQRSDAFRDIHLTVTDAGTVVCHARPTSGAAVEVIWSAGAPYGALGNTLPRGKQMNRQLFLESENKEYRFQFRAGKPTLIRMKDGVALWAPPLLGVEQAHIVGLDSNNNLEFNTADDKSCCWRSNTFGGRSDSSADRRASRFGERRPAAARRHPQRSGDRAVARPGAARARSSWRRPSTIEACLSNSSTATTWNRRTGDTGWCSSRMATWSSIEETSRPSGRAAPRATAIAIASVSCSWSSDTGLILDCRTSPLSTDFKMWGPADEETGVERYNDYSYARRGHFLEMSDDGFSVRSPSGKVVYWWVTSKNGKGEEVGFPKQGHIRVNPLSRGIGLRLCSDSTGSNQLFACSAWKHTNNADWRQIYTWVSATPKVADGHWVLRQIDIDKWILHNTKYQEYLFEAEDTRWKDAGKPAGQCSEFRCAFTSKHVFDQTTSIKPEQGIWLIAPYRSGKTAIQYDQFDQFFADPQLVNGGSLLIMRGDGRCLRDPPIACANDERHELGVAATGDGIGVHWYLTAAKD